VRGAAHLAVAPVIFIYFDCFSGAAGDMMLGAFVDAGVPPEVIRGAVEGLGLDGWELDYKPVVKAGLRATKAVVTIESGAPRDYHEIEALLDRARLDEPVRRRAQKAFRLLAEAEARVHGTADLNHVHFHDVGAVDALIDVVGSCAAFEHIAPDRAYASQVFTGTGSFVGPDGEFPIPAPAVVELLRGVPLRARGDLELVTPTGAALLRAFCDGFGEFPPMAIDRSGYGAGDSDTEHPNVLRILVGSPVPESGDVSVVEANIDDTNPELIPHVIQVLFDAGAHDAWATPIVMKKGRPAVTISALCDAANVDPVLDILFRETTTFGARVYRAHKHALEREWITTEVDGHSVRVKVARSGGRPTTAAVEFDDAQAVARATGRPLKEVYDLARRAAEDRLR
jgi:pyridinium-3,5-bisthiocarboxylic acid mononucleotide nickel chelatase